MADYRLSAQAISRGKGQSSVASAAYRSASRMIDGRTGEIHDYTRKQGVIHSEVMTPEGTPEWMHDRAQLWNAVETVETRKNSQLAREIQLSLPHELDHDQRKDLVRDFIRQQFVDRGMIADINIHLPDRQGDQRNHHAHIMLTMRELTGDGFHPKKATEKARSWNSDEQLLEWRKEWANHQNRALERHGHSSRVDHRSFEAQGIDREPSQHLGPTASDMERNGKPSRIGDENRVIANDNAERAQNHADRVQAIFGVPIKVVEAGALSKLGRESEAFWAEKYAALESQHKLADLDLSQRHHREKLRLEMQLKEIYGTEKLTIQAELNAVEKRLEAKGVRKILRSVFGQARSDRQTQVEMQATLAGIEKREQEHYAKLDRQQRIERQKEARRQNKHREGVKPKLTRSKQRQQIKMQQPRPSRTPQREAQPIHALTPAPPGFAQKKVIRPKKHVASNDIGAPKQSATPANKPLDAPDLGTEKTTISTKLDRLRGDAKRPWESAAFSNDNKRPWESDVSRDRDDEHGRSRTRGRSPSPEGGSSGGGGKDGK